MYCQQCGKKIPDAKFCIYCGADVTQNVRVKKPEPKVFSASARNPRKKRRMLTRGQKMFFLACIVIMIITAGMGFLLLRVQQIEMKALYHEIDQRIQSEYVSGDNLPAAMEYNNALLASLDYSITALDRSGGEITLGCTCVDALKLAEMLSGVTDAEEFYTKAASIMNEHSAPLLKRTVQLKYTSVGLLHGNVNVKYNDAFFDILSGGTYYEYLHMAEGKTA